MKLPQGFFISLFSFFLPVQGLLIAVGIAIVLDTFTGLFKTVKTNGWGSVTSRRLSDVVAKMLLYNTVILSLYLIDYFLLSEFFELWFSITFFFTKMAAVVLIIIELTSIKENFEAAFGINIFQMIKNMLKRSADIKNDISGLGKL